LRKKKIKANARKYLFTTNDRTLKFGRSVDGGRREPHGRRPASFCEAPGGQSAEHLSDRGGSFCLSVSASSHSPCHSFTCSLLTSLCRVSTGRGRKGSVLLNVPQPGLRRKPAIHSKPLQNASGGAKEGVHSQRKFSFQTIRPERSGPNAN